MTLNGEWLATNDSHVIRVWSLRSPYASLARAECSARVTSLAFAADGRNLGAGTEEGTLEIWDTREWKRIQKIRAHERAITNLVLSEKDQSVLTGSEDSALKIWDLHTYRPKSILLGHSGPITRAVRFNEDHCVASGSGDRTVKLWEIGDGSVATKCPCNGPIRWLSCLHSGHVLITTEHGNLLVWDVADWRAVSRIDVLSGKIHCLQVLTDGNELVVGHEDGTLGIWSIYPLSLSRELREHKTRIQAIAEARQNNLLLTASLDGLMVGWHNIERAEIFNLHLKEPAEQIFITKDVNEAYCYCRDGIMRILDLNSGCIVGDVKLAAPFASFPLFWDASRALLIGARPDGTVFSWNPNDGTTNTPSATAAMGTSITKSKDTNEYLISFSDGSCCILDTLTMSLKRTSNLGIPLKSMLVDSRQNVLFGLDLEGVLRVYSLSDFTDIATMTGDCAFSAFQLVSAGALVGDYLGGLHLFQLRMGLL
jgi:WD40 repeat protein